MTTLQLPTLPTLQVLPNFVMLPDFVMVVLKQVLLVYCGVMSFRAIQSQNPEDDKRWLTFW